MLIRVDVYRLPYTRADGPPPPAGREAEKPKQEAGFSVECSTKGDAKEEATKRLRIFGEEVRSLSHTTDGALAAVVYKRAPTSKQPRA